MRRPCFLREFYKAGIKFAFGTFNNEFVAQPAVSGGDAPWLLACLTTKP